MFCWRLLKLSQWVSYAIITSMVDRKRSHHPPWYSSIADHHLHVYCMCMGQGRQGREGGERERENGGGGGGEVYVISQIIKSSELDAFQLQRKLIYIIIWHWDSSATSSSVPRLSSEAHPIPGLRYLPDKLASHTHTHTHTHRLILILQTVQSRFFVEYRKEPSIWITMPPP
jgi:hypothetical protein